MKRKCGKPKPGPITVRNLSGGRIPARTTIVRTVRRVLDLEGAKDFGLAVIYVDDRYIKSLNRRYRKRSAYTDVLAFSMMEGPVPETECEHLGDIFISVDTARRQAGQFNSNVNTELKLYLIHGVLHLLGYDDETGAGLKRMSRRQEELLNKV